MAQRPAKPAALGYTFPPEWRRHASTWMSWPLPQGFSFPGRYEQAAADVAKIAAQVARYEPVDISVPDESWRATAARRLGELRCPMKRVRFHLIPTNECWCRDHGPAFVLRRGSGVRRTLAVVDWIFNAWGGKYPRYDDDNAVPSRVAVELGMRLFHARIVMEGGSVDFNGAGTVLTTESCLLNKNRNPRLSARQIERYLKDYYGQARVCWLDGQLAGDDTDGHVDDLARFVDARTIVTAVEADRRDENYQILRDNRRRLDLLRDQDGRAFRIVELPMPGVVSRAGQRLPATYVNFYFVNGALLVPTYGRKSRDGVALRTLQGLVPRRKVVGVDCRDVIWGRGAIHCLTQQQPVT